MKNVTRYFLILFTVSILSGCMYPQERLAENQVPYADQVESVQMAVNHFRKENDGLLPIKTKDNDTPLFLKYPVDFKKIAPRFIASAPGNAYESGGVYQYVLMDVEEDPKVKVFDLRIAEKIREIKIRINTQGYPPFKETVAKNVFSLDFKKIGYEGEQYVVSPYSNKNLPFVITGQGEIYVDYQIDIYEALQEKAHSFKPGDDVRRILYEESTVVPAYSLPYTIDENNEPIFMAN